jgi:hypothetical protein
MSGVARVVLFAPGGAQLAEIEPDVQSVAWRLNGVGQAKFTLPWSDPKCTQNNLRYGNRLLIQFNNGLPDWGGVIDLPRGRANGAVTSTAYSGEYLFDWRVTAKGRYFASMAPGYIFKTLLQEQNAKYPIGIDLGEIYEGGMRRTIEYHYHDLLERYKDLARLSGNDFSVTPEYIAGVLKFKANWHARRGEDKRETIWLLEGTNVTDAALDEQGSLANRVITIGQGQTWGTERLDAIVNNLDSRALYDYREYAEVESGVAMQATLQANAEAILAARAWPSHRITISASDSAPARFVDYDVGDILRAMLSIYSPEWIFDAPVRILAREWKPAGACRLEVEEYRPETAATTEEEWGS